jgi:hypothetical protein
MRTFRLRSWHCSSAADRDWHGCRACLHCFQIKSSLGSLSSKMVLSSVAVSSAVTEAIMQLLGAYFLGHTANIGRSRGFYLSHHIRPKMWGRNAHRMYVAALCWVMVCIPLIVVWFFVALFQSQVYDAVSGWRRRIYMSLKRREKKVPKLAQKPAVWLLDYINPDYPPTATTAATHPPPVGVYNNQPIPVYPDQPFPSTSDDLNNQPIFYGGPATGDLFSDQPVPVPHDSRRHAYTPLTQSDFSDQPIMVPRATSSDHRAASGGYTHSASMVQRRTASGGQYNSLSQTDDIDTIEVLNDQPVAQTNRSLPPREVTVPSHRNASHAPLLAIPTHNAGASSSADSSSNKRSDFKEVVNLKWKYWERKIIFAGAFFGVLAYIAQWVFWDGFVKTAGDRFCPPDIWKIARVWWGGAFLCKCCCLRSSSCKR